MAQSPREVKGFTIIPVILPPTPNFASTEPVQHFLYIRPHEPKIPTPDSNRSLFVANVPVDATLIHFRTLFAEQVGGTRIERVDFDSARTRSKRHSDTIHANGHASGEARGKKRKRNDVERDVRFVLPETWDRELHNSGSTAVVVFVDRASAGQAFGAVKKAVKASRNVHWASESVDSKLPALGLKRFTSHQKLRYPPPSQLQSLVETFMTAYSTREEALNRTRTRQRAVPDADGFITVTRGGRTGPARAEETKEKLEKMKEKENKKRKEMEMGGFYRFQVREAKKREAKGLIGKFEGDRKKVEEMSKRRMRRRPD